MKDWFLIHDIEKIDSPALVVYPERVKQNIALALQLLAGNAARLRPHVKTNKMSSVCQLMMEAGITKFKCATIAEAEMLAAAGARDVLLAYQPVGPKHQRLLSLVQAYPNTLFSCLADNYDTAKQLHELWLQHQLQLQVYIDVNIGMNRSGIQPQHVIPLLEELRAFEGIKIAGLHGYDGHIRDTDMAVRQARADAAFALVEALGRQAARLFHYPLTIVMGGTPTFPAHAGRPGIECSPGTFVFWDWGYRHQLPDQPFMYAALLVTRVISVLDETTICTDLGHKSVAAENPLPRVHFLNAQDALPIAQSEEHLVLKVPSGSGYKPGDVLYGVPVHICPTVALYDTAFTISDHVLSGEWQIIGRRRTINI